MESLTSMNLMRIVAELNAHHNAEKDELRCEIERLRAENAALRKALEYYGTHDEDCKYQPVYDIRCTCGFDTALAAKEE